MDAIKTPQRPLIVGGGPVGLAAALFLAQRGIPTRLIETLDEPVKQSKALAVNPRTLEILEPTGVTRQMLDLGKPIRGAQFHQDGHVAATIDFTGVHPEYPFLLALSQATTERLLARALESAGGAIERGRKLAHCRNVPGGVEVVIDRTSGGDSEITSVPWLLAADGAHSTARQEMGIDFVGSSMEYPWYLADAPLETGLPQDFGHVFILDEGEFLFLIRVIDEDERTRPGLPLWRVIGNRPRPLSRLLEARQGGEVVWQSDFRIAHRVAETLGRGNVFLAGDAAHVHSPLGARGMNLGVEDAFVFAELAVAKRLDDYDGMRHTVDGNVVRRVRLLTRIAAGETATTRFARAHLFARLIGIAPFRGQMTATASGLDHKLPTVPLTRAAA